MGPPGLNLGPQIFQALICPTPGVRTSVGTPIKGDPVPVANSAPETWLAKVMLHEARRWRSGQSK